MRRLLRSARCARGPRGQARPGIEPARAWQSLRGELLAQFNITGCCHEAPQSLRCAPLGAGPLRFASRPSGSRQPPLCLAPLRACRVASWVQLATLEGISMCGHGFAIAARVPSMARCARGHGVGPRPPTIRPPRGLPGFLHCPAQRSAVLATSRVRFAGLRPPLTRLRAALRGAGQRRSP